MHFPEWWIADLAKEMQANLPNFYRKQIERLEREIPELQEKLRIYKERLEQLCKTH